MQPGKPDCASPQPLRPPAQRTTPSHTHDGHRVPPGHTPPLNTVSAGRAGGAEDAPVLAAQEVADSLTLRCARQATMTVYIPPDSTPDDQHSDETTS